MKKFKPELSVRKVFRTCVFNTVCPCGEEVVMKIYKSFKEGECWEDKNIIDERVMGFCICGDIFIS